MASLRPLLLRKVSEGASGAAGASAAVHKIHYTNTRKKVSVWHIAGVVVVAGIIFRYFTYNQLRTAYETHTRVTQQNLRQDLAPAEVNWDNVLARVEALETKLQDKEGTVDGV